MSAISAREYRPFARQCAEWATQTDTDQDRNALLDLARDWTFAALVLDQEAKEHAPRIEPRA
jgi:hypothetical protein